MTEFPPSPPERGSIHDSATNDVLQVNTRAATTAASICLVTMLIFLVPFFCQKKPMALAGYLGLLSWLSLIVLVLLYFLPTLLNSGTITFDDQGIAQQSRFGSTDITWREIQSAEIYPGAMLFRGDSPKILVMSAPHSWGGESSEEARCYLNYKLNEFTIPVTFSEYRPAPQIRSRG